MSGSGFGRNVVARRWPEGLVLLGTLVSGWVAGWGASAFALEPRLREAQELVREALQQESEGTTSERERLLVAAASLAPQNSAVHWHRGQVQFQGKWLSPEEVATQATESRTLAEYASRRRSITDTAAAQAALAEWCARVRLPDQARAHYLRTLELAPDHVEARLALGFVRVGDDWVTAEQWRAWQEARRNADRIAAKHGARLVEIAADLGSERSRRRDAGRRRLGELVSDESLPVVESMVSPAGPLAALAVVQAISQLTSPVAVDSLLRHAIQSPWPQVRAAAAQALGSRVEESYVPQLVGALRTPILGRVQVTRGADGRLWHRQVYTRDTQDRREQLTIERTLRSAEWRAPFSSRPPGADLVDASQDALERTLAVQRQNEFTEQLNQRVTEALLVATRANPGATPEAWWNWWNERNELFVAIEKPVVEFNDARTERWVAPTTPPPPFRPSDCLVAGTPVVTAHGPRAIESIQLGDLVLSQSPDSGELAFRPVIATSRRPVGQLVIVEAGADRLQCSGGHLFWVSGAGWVKARQLTPGMRLRSATQTFTVRSVTTEGAAETFNLVVADFHTYFTGTESVLCHDNTLRRPTAAIVPGLVK